MVQKGRTMKEENDLCYDIPLLESLQKLMQMEVVRDQVRKFLHNINIIVFIVRANEQVSKVNLSVIYIYQFDP